MHMQLGNTNLMIVDAKKKLECSHLDLFSTVDHPF